METREIHSYLAELEQAAALLVDYYEKDIIENRKNPQWQNGLNPKAIATNLKTVMVKHGRRTR